MRERSCWTAAFVSLNSLPCPEKFPARPCSDLHATILHQLGLDLKTMEVLTLGRTMRLVEEGAPLKEIIT